MLAGAVFPKRIRVTSKIHKDWLVEAADEMTKGLC